MVSAKTRFWILIALVTISGFSQGMLLPLLAIILEHGGISSSVNGLHATGLYIGVILASPFMEKPMRRLGFKPIILIGGMLVFLSLALFPLWEALWFWFILRMLIGVGDQMLHFGTQTWITTTATKETRGRSIAYYGLFFGLGFALGPLMTRMLSVNEALPFLASAVLSLLVWSMMFFVKNMWPENDLETATTTSSVGRFIQTGKIAWIALLPGFGYGFLEASLHGIFPIYGLRIGHDVNMLSLIIPCFAFGSLITQLPLGILSDRLGRKPVLLFVLAGGVITFGLAALLESSVVGLFILFTLSGMFVGSLFSLGISYMTDLLPGELLPAGNLMVGVTFSLGSISGPFLGGLYVELFPDLSFFYLIMTILLLIMGAIHFKKTNLSTPDDQTG
ncbi:MFS transporter [Virgibacillus halodenitrificans]|uniref:MFS transporter n=1 Tax=Virgibacillus halodenitrificans TaxID=1482 RepID=A0AAC9IY88_VIRHA|nr:MFS transporter [Virgibacillus halodenitrificans]APC47235.1 MFS transporter [Virgibacillus halodenitrificans]MBD1223679.1 MFS transporter [Virgibacillus halodenitrificans]MCG1028056.1 MFS transporter [Virgibacillus halodenitrificans]MCJ0933338.1 MFS transporter [Virgibacillus halodenitrificans]MEC2159326.1 MFS transporter [Virgibacillus halodenitrificans]